MARMLAEGRHATILERLGRDGVISVAELATELDVSRETIRRDIKQLAGRNRLRAVHGGASVLSFEADIADRKTVNPSGKAAIGRFAAQMVPDGASVILDSGTTTMAVAVHLAGRRGLTVYTNSLPIARLMGSRQGHKVIVLGGDLQPHDDATLGWDAVATLDRYRADFAFIGAGGVTDEPALTDYSRAAAELRGRMLVVAKTPVVVADHTKFGRTTPVRVPNFEKAARLITDRAPGRDITKRLKAFGIILNVAR
jgi:DeoR family transcriptional regulator, glycerol-3-phosphate regulon repressor